VHTKKHPIYADVGVWERAKDLHLSARHEDATETDEVGSLDDEDDDEYEAAVATLYEMLGYGIPAEELARFASGLSEKNGWFQSERGQTLMVLARRLCARREQGASAIPGKKSDIELINPGAQLSTMKPERNRIESPRKGTGAASSLQEDDNYYWVESSWCHPAAQSTRRMSATEKTRRPGTQNLLNMLDEQKVLRDSGRQNPKHMKRAAVTSMAYLGSSVVATGGLDGGVFLARRVKHESSRDSHAYDGVDSSSIRGVHLDWGSSGSRYTAGSASNNLDGEYGVGAVSCLASTRSTSSAYSHVTDKSAVSHKGVAEPLTEEELLEAMEGCRVVAGTTCGDLRVWTIKDVFSAVFYSNGDGATKPNDTATTKVHRSGEGVSSKFVSGRRKGTDFAAGSSLTRLKFSLRGRALSGHRGGVSCIDVPSNVYRPDSIITGGADGLIKLWSLRSPGTGAGRRGSDVDPRAMQVPTAPGVDPSTPRKASQSGDALSILSGHGGRILCVKTAWHGDRLLSGGADRTVRVWDLAGGGGKCLHSLSGHFGWVTRVQYWGPNTIISASTDRSIALWDARVRSSPLFSLRHHYAPVSDLLVGSRTDPIMISAASDGSIAAWDFRCLSGGDSGSSPADKNKARTQVQVVRDPPGSLYLRDCSKRRCVSGPVLLSRGPSRDRKTAMCVGSDAIVREWDYQTGDVVSEHPTGHCDLISNFESLQGDRVYDTQLEGSNDPVTGTITTSWDGTVRVRTLVRK